MSDDRRWQWGGPGGGSGGQEREEVFRKLQEQRQTGDNSSGQVRGTRTGHGPNDD